MARRLRASVSVTSPVGEPILLKPGDEVPEWAIPLIQNPKAWEQERPVVAPVGDAVTRLAPLRPLATPDEVQEFVESMDHSPTDTDEGAETTPEPEAEQAEAVEYTSMTKADLLGLIEDRNAAGESIPTDGNKADLIDALEAADKAQAGDADADVPGSE